MTIRSIFRALPALLLPLAVASCSNDSDDPVTICTNMGQAKLSYEADGTWSEVASNLSFTLQYLNFNHEGEIGPWGLSWKGFTPARWVGLDYATVTDGWLAHQFQIPSQGGVAGQGTPYVVGFWDTQENETTPAEARSCRITYGVGVPLSFRPQSVMVQLNCYAYYTIVDGDDFCRPFTTGDWLLLTAHGVHPDGTESSTDIYLADYRDEAHPTLVADWTEMNLSGLGDVTEIYFTMASSDTGQWGMNTPSYFALDRLTVLAHLPEN